LQELDQVIGIKLLTSGSKIFFFLRPNFQEGKCPFQPPADAHDHPIQTTVSIDLKMCFTESVFLPCYVTYNLMTRCYDIIYDKQKLVGSLTLSDQRKQFQRYKCSLSFNSLLLAALFGHTIQTKCSI